MNGELWAPGKPIFTKPYCGKQGSAAMDPIIPSYSWDSDEGTEQSTKPKKTRKKSSCSWRPRMETLPSTAKFEEGYCNEATQSEPLTHSQSHQAQNTVEHTEVKQKRAWTKEEIREVIW